MEKDATGKSRTGLTTIQRFGVMLTVVCWGLSAAPTAATVYFFTETLTLDTTFYRYSITTNGTQGQLAASDIVDFDFFSSRKNFENFPDVHFNLTSGRLLYTGGIIASPTDLTFDFSGNKFVQFIDNSGRNFLCFNGASTTCAGGDVPGAKMVIVGDQNYSINGGGLSGVQSIAATGPGAPAPSLGAGLFPALGSLAALFVTRLRRSRAAFERFKKS